MTQETTGSRGDVFVVRTSKPVENLWKNGLFWSRYSFVTHSIYRKPRDWGLASVVYINFWLPSIDKKLRGFLINFVHRYFAVHVPYISFVRKTIGILNHGPNPPPVLRLSDGGHVENLGILPLLKLRLKKIITVYGGRASSEQAFCNTLLKALEMARKKLRCSFTGLDGRDITEDIRNKLVEKSSGNQPRSYRLVNRKTCLKKITFFHKITLATAGLAQLVECLTAEGRYVTGSIPWAASIPGFLK